MLKCVVRNNSLGICLIKETKLADFFNKCLYLLQLSMHDFNSLYLRQNIAVKIINTIFKISYLISNTKIQSQKKIKMIVKIVNKKNHWRFTVTFYFQEIVFLDPATYATTECPFQHTTEKTTMPLKTCTMDTVPSGPKVDGGSMLVRKQT